MFEYFPNHYSWNMGLLMAAQLGGELGEIDEACRPLRELAGHPGAKDDPKTQAAWIEQWSTLARKIEEFARRDETAGHSLSAGKKFQRACLYWFTAERMASHKSPQKLAMYKSMLRLLRSRRALAQRADRVRQHPVRGHDLVGAVPSRARERAKARNDPFRRLRCYQGMDVSLWDFARVRGTRHFDIDDRPSRDRRRAAAAGALHEPRERALGVGGDGLARKPRRRRCTPGRRRRHEPGWLLRAPRRGVRETSRSIRGLGRALGECPAPTAVSCAIRTLRARSRTGLSTRSGITEQRRPTRPTARSRR